MTTSLQQAMNIHMALAAIADQPLAGEVAGQVVRLRQWALPLATRYGRTVCEILNRHGEQQSNMRWVVKNENFPAFAAEWQAACDTAVEPPPADRLPRAAIAALQITATHLESLGPVIAP